VIEENIRIVDQGVSAALQRVRLALGGQMATVFREIGRMLLTSLRLRFIDQKGPDGKPWVKSKRVLAHGGQTLRLSGRLRNSFTYRSDEHKVEVGTNVVYARPLHFGKKEPEKVRPHDRKVTVVFGVRLSSPVTAHVKGFTRKPNLPPRPMVGVSVQDRKDLFAILGRHLFQATGSRLEG
jgi:phage gpG-like protein